MAIRKRPRVAVIAMGGTIAGVCAEETDTHTYKTGVCSLEHILAGAPELNHIANIIAIPCQNKGGPDITFSNTIELVWAIRQAHKQGAVGAVVLIGTDILSEVACIVDMLVGRGILVVMTGAIRPGNARGSDGLHHLGCSVRLVIDPQARDRGVLVPFADSIHSAWNVVKRYAHQPNAFDSGMPGTLGCFVDSSPLFYRRPCMPMDKREFDFDSLFPKGQCPKDLPQVDIELCHMDAPADKIEDSVRRGVRGIILAGLGAGSWPTKVGQAVQRIKNERGNEVIFVASRQPEGYVQDGMYGLGECCIPSGFFDPLRSRLLLILCLLARYDEWEIRKVFDPSHEGVGPSCTEGCRCGKKKPRARI